MKNFRDFSGPVLLCILDGWGIGDENNPHNAIAQANLTNYSRILKTYPYSQLQTSGLAVGLPEGQIGNSEVGHMTIGAGRVIFQDLPRINNAINDGELENNHELQNLITTLKETGKAAHLLGLMSDGGVHSHQDHIQFLAKTIADNGIKVYIHAFLDGRDVAQKSAIEYLVQFFSKIKNNSNIHLATIAGRYYAMDRDNKWDRIKLAYDAIVSGKESEKQKEFRDKKLKVNKSDSLNQLEEAKLNILENYNEGIFDEFIMPCVIGEYSGINDQDAIISCNFRADRIRQISNALLNPGFTEFVARKINFSSSLAMTQYSEDLNRFYKILFPPQNIQNSLPSILSNNGLKQLRVAETEKYAHVTFFFSCGREEEMVGEKRILIKSPSVATYDLKPEMSALEVGSKLCEAISSNEFDFIIVNYANPDMVGHSGDLAASIKACQVIDKQLAILEKIILEKDGIMLISADHGNIECMIDENNFPNTMHTTNPVPFILIGRKANNFKLHDGALSDIAPTVLSLMKIMQPQEMTGKNLISIK